MTVDSSQGSEFDYVVLSTVRSNKDKKIGFVANKQRINVAISRSLYGLVVVGKSEIPFLVIHIYLLLMVRVK